ncbi:MAG: alpha/beta hydrolase [Zoogloeaceae bacterium]|jgi:pimeloyl-ACP methyl ester carboxylesterase|nr:alpha/beta hydrolase [Zoogloeaceae bacterium]
MDIPFAMTGFLSLAPRGKPQTLEYAWFGREAEEAESAPALVFLHEGLGSVAAWRQFPARVCAVAKRRALAYSRYGYGASTPRPHAEAFPLDYLEREALDVLPALLDALRIEKPWLVGHSDGGSIALIAAARDAGRYSGIVTIASHYRVEEICLKGIERARVAYETGTLREKLARCHADTDSAFHGWCDAWLDPARRGWNVAADLKRITLPVLAIQGRQDEYATLDQIEAIARAAPQTELLVIENCGHFPHIVAPQAMAEAIAAFVAR